MDLSYHAEDVVRCWVVSQIRSSPSAELNGARKIKKQINEKEESKLIKKLRIEETEREKKKKKKRENNTR